MPYATTTGLVVSYIYVQLTSRPLLINITYGGTLLRSPWTKTCVLHGISTCQYAEAEWRLNRSTVGATKPFLYGKQVMLHWNHDGSGSPRAC